MRPTLLYCLLLFSVKVFSQDYIDIAKISYTISPNNSFENGENGTTMDEFNLQIDLPHVINERDALIFSLAGNVNNIGLHPDQRDNSHLTAINLRLGLNRQYNETWSGTYLVIPKITTDFSNGLKQGYQVGFVALVNQKKSPRLKYTYGIYTNTEEFGQLVVPLLGGYYMTKNGKWEFTALMPALFDINHKISPKTSLGINYEGIGTTYSIDNNFYKDSYVTRGVTQLYTYAQFKLTSSLFLRTKAGYEIRSYRIFDEHDKVSLSLASIYFGDNRKQLNTELKNNFMFKFEFFYRFSLSKDNSPTLNEKL